MSVSDQNHLLTSYPYDIHRIAKDPGAENKEQNGLKYRQSNLGEKHAAF
jgi:hypothetical protein